MKMKFAGFNSKTRYAVEWAQEEQRGKENNHTPRKRRSISGFRCRVTCTVPSSIQWGINKNYVQLQWAGVSTGELCEVASGGKCKCPLGLGLRKWLPPEGLASKP